MSAIVFAHNVIRSSPDVVLNGNSTAKMSSIQLTLRLKWLSKEEVGTDVGGNAGNLWTLEV